MKNLSIIIPTLNNTSGLEYLLSYFNKKPYQLIIIDNARSRGKKRFVKNFKGKILYLPQKKNLGFAKAVNLGVKRAKGEWMLILNDDIEFEIKNARLKGSVGKIKNYNSKLKITKDPIKKLLDFAKKYRLEAVSPVLVNLKGKIENVGYQVLPYGKVKLINDYKVWNLVLENWKLFGNWKLEIGNFKVDGLTAACLLIKRKVFEDLGGFDESFFAYLEDVEFFLRFKKKGYKFAVAPIIVVHNHMTTTKKLGLFFKAKRDLVNWWRIALKHSDYFKFDLRFFEERLRNLSGVIKAVLK